jgi:hypothetical protein
MRNTKMGNSVLMKFFVFLIAIILVAANVNSVCANVSVKQKALPSFLESYLLYQCAQANLDSTEINEMRAIWINQLEKRQDRLNAMMNTGLVEESTVNSALDYPFTNWIDSVDRTEPWGGGVIYNEYSVIGEEDGLFAELYTPVTGAGASIVGTMNIPSGGDVFAFAELGPTGAQHVGNYLVVEVAHDLHASMGEWIAGFVGYAHIMDPWGGYGGNYYIGPAPYVFSYITVGANVMPPPNPLDPYNDVMVDSVWTTIGYPPHTLTISSGSGGTTDPAPGVHEFSYQTNVYAMADRANGYVLDYWELDYVNVGNSNPITVDMTNDHILTAHFRLGSYYTLELYATEDGNELNPSVYIDNEWVGYAPLYMPILEGPHEVYIETPYYDPGGHLFFTWQINGNNHNENPVQIYANFSDF